VPGDLSVVGFDNVPLSSFTIPPLTTVDQPKQALGRRSVEMCRAALDRDAAHGEVADGQTAPAASPPAVVLDGQLVIRQSAGPAPAGTAARRAV
jgi:DNA-binding LacI/PurR family transcriptional regulator